MDTRTRRDRLFSRVLEAHGHGLWRLTAGYARARADREDLYQDILLAVLGALPSFREESSLRTFVYRIGHNQGITHRRRETRAPSPVSIDGLTSPAPTPEEHTVARSRRDVMLEGIRGLPHGRRQVLMLHLEGLDNGEIADVLGISVNNVGVRLHRAKSDLRRELDPVFGERL